MQKSITDKIESLKSQFQILDTIDCDYSNIDKAKIVLFERLNSLYKPRFEDNERICVVLEKDFYATPGDHGKILSILQNLIQQIDISNFFICILTTNTDIQREYQWVLENVSLDPVPCTIHICAGQFDKIMIKDQTFTGKIDSLVDKRNDIAMLSKQEKNLLFENKVFCMMPWVGINITPNSDVKPCCEFNGSIGNLKKQSLDAIWQSTEMQTIRHKMLNDIPPQECMFCHHKEKIGRDSLRKSINRDFLHRVKEVQKTDSTYDRFNLGYIDIRYNNLCNLTCRSCDPYSSSSWLSLHNHLYPETKMSKALLQAGDDQNYIYDQIIKHIDSIEKIYFAGGEPLMIENFYRLLELLIEKDRHAVELVYNTNLTNLSLKNKNIIELWNQFEKVSVGASLDATEIRGQYLRVGSDWSEIQANARKIRQQSPHVDFYVSATTGLINALHVPDFHKDWVNQDFIKPENFNIQILYNPSWMSVSRAPKKLKEQIINRYETHIEWLRPLDKLGRATSGFVSIIEMCKSPDQYDPDVFWVKSQQLDSFFDTNLLQVFPELRDVGL